MSDRTDRLTALVAAVQRRWGTQALQRAPLDGPASAMLPTGIAALDTWLPNRGLLRGTLSEFCGVPTCGLTTLALQVAAHTQAVGGRVLWLDLTGTFDPFAASKHHIDLSALILVRPRDGPEALALLDELVRERAARLLVVSGTTQLQAGAASPAAWDAALRRLTHATRRSGRTVLFLTHLAPDSLASGLLPHPALALHLRAVAWLQEVGMTVGYRVVLTRLHATGGPGSQPLTLTLHP